MKKNKKTDNETKKYLIAFVVVAAGLTGVSTLTPSSYTCTPESYTFKQAGQYDVKYDVEINGRELAYADTYQIVEDNTEMSLNMIRTGDTLTSQLEVSNAELDDFVLAESVQEITDDRVVDQEPEGELCVREA